MLSSKQKNLLSFGAMVLMFLLPVLIANLYYYYGDIKGGITNQGQLITEPHNISELSLTPSQLANTDNWQENRWRIIHRLPTVCDKNCEQVIFKLQQVHIALGKNINRVQRINIHTASNNSQELKNNWSEVYTKYPHIVAVFSQTNTGNKSHFSENIINSDNIYLADPLGNIILSYQIKDNKFDSKLMKDTKKLLNLSKIG